MSSVYTTIAGLHLPQSVHDALKAHAATFKMGIAPFVRSAMEFYHPLTTAPTAARAHANGPTHYMGFRLPPAIKAALQHAAKLKGVTPREWTTLFCARLVSDGWAPPGSPAESHVEGPRKRRRARSSKEPSAFRYSASITTPPETFVALKARAASFGMSVSTFVSAALTHAGPLASTPRTPMRKIFGPIQHLSLKLPPERLQELRHAAKTKNISVTKWLTMFCDRLVTDNWSPPPADQS